MVLNDGAKMSKSLGNTVDPEEIIEKFGADTIRLFILFSAPVDKDLEWSDKGIEGSNRFVKRIWNFVTENISLANKTYDDDIESLSIDEKNLLIKIHKTTKKVSQGIDGMQFNTSIAALMELLNSGYKFLEKNRNDKLIGFFVSQFLQLLNPFIPHISNELWSLSKYNKENLNRLWPTWDDKIISKDDIKIVVQINGKTRGTLSYSSEIVQEEIVLNDIKKTQALYKYIVDKKIVKTIYVENKLLNLIVK